MKRKLFVFFIVSILYLAPSAHASTLPPKLCTITNIIQQVISIALAAGGVATFIIFLMGGLQWLTAGANDQAVGQAKSTITWAIIGMVLLMASYFILVLIGNFTGITSLTTIEFPWIGGVAKPSECN